MYIHTHTHTHTPHIFIHSFSTERLGWFHSLAVVNNAAIDMGGCIYLFKLVFLYSLGKCPEVKLLDCVVVLFWIFWGASIPFSIVAIPIYSLTSSAWGFSFFHILSNTCFLSGIWGAISLWFRVAFPWWVVTLSIFSRTCWPFVCLLWNSVYLCPMPIFIQIVYLFILLSYMSALYVLVITSYGIYHLQLSSPIQWVAFLFRWCFLLLCERFLVWCCPICLFLLLLPLPKGDRSKKNIAKTNAKDHTDYVYF